MRLDVRVVRNGRNEFYWDRNLLILRKPATFDPSRKRIYEYAQAKCDGNRVIVVKHEGHTRVFTTQGIDISEQIRACEWYSRLHQRLPEGAWVDGEIYVEGKGREAVKTSLAADGIGLSFGGFGTSELAWNTPPGAIVAFFGGIDVPMLPIIRTTDPDAALAGMRELGTHWDGVVLKCGQYGAWAKHKFQRTIDLVVMSTKPAKEGKFFGMVGSLEGCVVHDGKMYTVANVSGMDDTVRASLSDNDIGRVMEVEYERVGSGGRLQHPRFLAWRDDKPACDCGPDQDPALEAIITC